jgi:hypothetical protein
MRYERFEFTEKDDRNERIGMGICKGLIVVGAILLLLSYVWLPVLRGPGLLAGCFGGLVLGLFYLIRAIDRSEKKRV